MRISRTADPTLVTRTDAPRLMAERGSAGRGWQEVSYGPWSGPFPVSSYPSCSRCCRVWSMNRLMAAPCPSYRPRHTTSSDYGLLDEKYADTRPNDWAGQRAELARADSSETAPAIVRNQCFSGGFGIEERGSLHGKESANVLSSPFSRRSNRLFSSTDRG